MNPATTEFLRQRFTEYYKKTVLVAPPLLDQREWGFVLFHSGPAEMRMHRHIGFLGRDELFDYIRNLIPQHVYYSTAYYEKPDAGTMADKGWCGADLIFDLDADHLMRGPYDRMLLRVKEETEKLLAILTNELGIDQKSIEVVFSGGRGYHVHVRDLAFRHWGSSERRDIIDYVCGIGISPAAMLAKTAAEGAGWHKRYRQAVRQYLGWLGGQNADDAMKYLMSHEGIGEKTAGRLLAERETILDNLGSRPDKLVVKGRVREDALRILLEQEDGEFKKILTKQAALADEPVTTDTKRLIRLPTSLHGGSGMRVQPLSIRDLPAFDPLVDAVVFGTRDIRVNSGLALKVPMLGSTYELKKGINTVPEAAAVFLGCRGIAEIA